MASSKWKTMRLSEVAEVRRGLSWSKQQECPAATASTMPVLRIGNVQDRLVVDDLLHLDGVSQAEREAYAVSEGWSLMVASNGNPARVGSCVYIDREMDFVFASFLIALSSSDSSVLRNPYLYRLLRSKAIRRAVSKNVQGSTGLRNINLPLLLKQKVEVPSIGEQDKIVAILGAIDAAIERTRAVIEQVRVVKQALLADLMTNGLPGRHKKFKTVKKLGRVPHDWSATTIGACMDFITDYRGKTPPYVDDGIPVISAENVGDGRIRSTTKYVTPEVYSQWTTRGFPEPDDVVFTTEAPVAEVALLPGDRTYLLTRRVMALRSRNDHLRKRFLFWHLYLLKSCGAWETYCHGSTVPRILKPDILNKVIPLPSTAEQDDIVRLLDGVEYRHLAEKTHLKQLGIAKSALSDALLTGDVRVPVGKEAVAR